MQNTTNNPEAIEVAMAIYRDAVVAERQAADRYDVALDGDRTSADFQVVERDYSARMAERDNAEADLAELGVLVGFHASEGEGVAL